MKTYYLYRHIRLDTNEVFYIGIGTSSLKTTCYSHKYRRAYSKSKRSKFWYNIVDRTTYKVEIIFSSESLEEIKLKETKFIKLYGRRNLGLGSLVNLTDGGELNNNIIVSEAKKEKLRLANLGLKHPEWRNEIKSKAQGGENHWTKKKGFTDGAKVNMSNAQKKLYNNGYVSHRLGKSNSVESIQKVVDKISIPILQFDLLGNLIKEWKSVAITKEFGFNPTHISQCCKNKRKTHKKFIWKYKK